MTDRAPKLTQSQIKAVKQFLFQARRSGVLLESLLDELERLRSVINRVTASAGADFSGEPDPKRAETAITELLEFEKVVAQLVEELIELRRTVIGIILRVEDVSACEVLSKRYINGLTWNVISYEMGLSYRHVFRLHERGLELVAELIGKDL